MKERFNELLRSDFSSFVGKAFRHLHDGERLDPAPYVDFLCHELGRVATAETRRLIVNLPPRHLKTVLGSICLPAWLLGRQPAAQVMIVAYSESLAEDIAYKIRSLMTCNWYRAAFKTRLAADRSRANDFATVQGGGVLAGSIDGSLTGRGANLILFDDPLNISDADNMAQIAKVNARFDSLVMSRLNNPKRDAAVIIAHRLNEDDLSGHLKDLGGWRHVALPMIAPRRRTYDLGYREWCRKKGELLRPDAFGKKEIKRIMKTTTVPDFETLYQQNPIGAGSMRVKRDSFQIFTTPPREHPVVLSIDPGQRAGPRNSFTVIQAWAAAGENLYLIDQWREQSSLVETLVALKRFSRRYRPSVALIEVTAQGPALITEAYRLHIEVKEIVPDGNSKAERLRRNLATFRKKRIFLPQGADWRHDYVEEFLTFPGASDDQVDATTQFLDWIATKPVIPKPFQRALSAVTSTSFGSTVFGATAPASPSEQPPGCVLVRRSRW